MGLSNPLWTACLLSSSPRYEQWRQILGCDSVPLESPQRYLANLGPERDVVIYKLSVAELKPDQRERLVSWLVGRFGGDPADIERELSERGFPIRESDVIVAFSLRPFL
jgi:hypothetical protein